MRLIVLVAAFALNACGSIEKSQLEDSEPKNELPVIIEIHDPVTANVLDKNVVMPGASLSLADYERYYSKNESGWSGVFVRTGTSMGKAHINAEPWLPDIADGGCIVVRVSFDADMKFLGAMCNGQG